MEIFSSPIIFLQFERPDHLFERALWHSQDSQYIQRRLWVVVTVRQEQLHHYLSNTKSILVRANDS